MDLGDFLGLKFSAKKKIEVGESSAKKKIEVGDSPNVSIGGLRCEDRCVRCVKIGVI